MLRSKTDIAATNTPGKPTTGAPVAPQAPVAPVLTSTTATPSATATAPATTGVPSSPSLDDAPVEDDPEYHALLQRGYKREQASMIIKKKRSRQSLSPTTSNNTLPSTATNGTGTTPGNRLMSFSDIPLVSVSSDDVVEHKSPERVALRPTTTSKPLTSVQERSVQNLMTAGMTREDATLYVCSGASNMTEVLAALNSTNANRAPTTTTATAATTSPAGAASTTTGGAVKLVSPSPSPLSSPTVAAATATTQSPATNFVRYHHLLALPLTCALISRVVVTGVSITGTTATADRVCSHSPWDICSAFGDGSSAIGGYPHRHCYVRRVTRRELPGRQSCAESA